MYRITKQFNFSASHCLPKVAPDHPCAHIHGHNYVVTVALESRKLNEQGFILDYREMTPMKTWIDEVLDHKHLNDVWTNPTAETMARKIYDLAVTFGWPVAWVEVSETPKTNARYTPE